MHELLFQYLFFRKAFSNFRDTVQMQEISPAYLSNMLVKKTVTCHWRPWQSDSD